MTMESSLCLEDRRRGFERREEEKRGEKKGIKGCTAVGGGVAYERLPT
jgi:hypothetical protein